MSQEIEIKAQLELVAKEVKSVVEEAKKDAKAAGEMSEKTEKTVNGLLDTVKALQGKLEDSVDKEIAKKMQDQLDAIDIKLQRETPESKGNFQGSLRKALEERIDKLKAMGVNATNSQAARDNGFSFKAVGNMSIAGNVTGELPQALLLSGMNAIPSRQVTLLSIVNSGSIQSNLVKWAYQSGKEGAAGQTTEGALKNQIDFDILLGSEDVVKTTAFIKVSDEMIEDIDFIQSEINNELMRELLKAVELGVYSGAGTTNTLHGIRDVATAFAAGSFAATVDNANVVDVLTVAANQIMIAEQGMPNYIMMHPTNVTALKLVKVSATDKRYVERLINVGGTYTLDGIPIIPTTLVTVGEYLIGDFTRASVLQRSGVNIEVGLDSDDFTKNLRTIRAEWRGVAFVKNNDRSAFVKGVIATDAAALETA
jgi:hypothetical protein